MPNLIPEPHADYVMEVCKLVGLDTRSLRDQISQKAGLSTSYATRLVEDPTIICVAGERGSGKTTVLAAAAAQLSADGHVVIPPVRPEYFAASGSLIPTVVAHLRTTVRSDWGDKGNKARDLKMTRAIDRTLRQANLISYSNTSDASPLRADEQAADRSLTASADSDFLDNWRELTTRVRGMAARHSKPSKRPVIVIPVDDPDLSPGTLRQILLDLRVITSVDGVVGITCLDLEEARSVLADAYTSSYTTAPNRLLTARVVEAQIAKAFPDDRRVTIDGLDPDHRLSFKALDLPLPSIEHLCSVHKIGGEYGKDTAASILRMPRTKEPSLYARALSSNPRDLRALAYRLSRIDDSPSSASDAAIQLCRSAVETGLKQSGATDPDLWPAGMPFEIQDQAVGGVPSCVVRYDEILIRGERHAERPMFGSKDDDGTLFVSVGYDGGVEAHLVHQGDKSKVIQRLDPSLTYALLLVREFSHYYSVIHANISGSPPIRGGDRSSNFMIVRMDGKVTDDRFLTAPAWEAFYDYFVLDEGLREVVAIATSPHEFSDRRLAIEAYFIDFCRNIVSVQMTRMPAKKPARVSLAIRKVDSDKARKLLDRELSRLFRDVGKCLDEEGALIVGANGVRGEDFQHWVEVGISNMCHDRLLTPGFIEKLISYRTRILDSIGRLQTANSALCASLESRIKAAIDEPWVFPLIQLTQILNEELGNMLLLAHRNALETVERSRRRLLAESAMESPAVSSAPVAEASTSEFDLALEVLEQIEGEVQSRILRSGH